GLATGQASADNGDEVVHDGSLQGKWGRSPVSPFSGWSEIENRDTGLRPHEELQGLCDERLHVFPVDDSVQHTVLDKEFAALEAFGEFLADRLFDDARSGKANESPGLGDVKIA